MAATRTVIPCDGFYLERPSGKATDKVVAILVHWEDNGEITSWALTGTGATRLMSPDHGEVINGR